MRRSHASSTRAGTPVPFGKDQRLKLHGVEGSIRTKRHPGAIAFKVKVGGLGLLAALGLGPWYLLAQNADINLRAGFQVKYVAAGVVYTGVGKNAGLETGMTLVIQRVEWTEEAGSKGKTQKLVDIARIRVTAVAEASAACEILESTAEVRAGDWAYLDEGEVKKKIEQQELSGSRHYPQIISFSDSNLLEEEARAAVPRPRLPEISRGRGLVGFEYGGLASGGQFPSQTTQLGLLFRGDLTRINGTYWNLNGFWRGRFNTQSLPGQQQSLQDLVNRTYHLGLTYDNPQSPWVAGFGRLYLPWATSLDTIDGGYVGHRIGKAATTGLFAGSTPDPSSWDYNPHQRIGGAFLNLDGGSFEHFHYSSTVGVGVTSLGWTANQEFVFDENEISYQRFVSLYQALQANVPVVPTHYASANFSGVTRSFVTLHLQPVRRVEIDLNHNYFRNIPTFDLGLIGTGLVDQLLFQGFSAGVRVELLSHLTVYNSLGRSSETGDARGSWNQMYGITVDRIWRSGLRADVRYSKFDSSFGRGDYSLISLSRQIGDRFRWEVLAGNQNMTSPLTRSTSYRNLGTDFEWFLKSGLYMDGGFTRQFGAIQNYSQWYTGLGYRFDTYRHHRTEWATR